MRVLWLLQRAKQTGARSVGERLGYGLSEQTDHEVMFMVPSPIDIQNESPFVMDGNVHIPTVNLYAAVCVADPDVIVAHTVSPELTQTMPLIRSRYPVLFRYGVNLTETYIKGNRDELGIYPEFVRQFDAFLAPGEHAAKKLAGYGIEKGRIHVVEPAISFDREQADPDSAPHAVGMVARHSRVKNHPLLIRALRYYEDEYGNAPEVLCAGKTMGQDPPAMTHARDMAIDHKVRILDWANPFEAVYPNVRAVVLPSLSENFPAVYPEALSMGVPVLAPRAGWSIPPAQFMPDDPASLALNLKTVLEAPSEYHALQMEEAPDGVKMKHAIPALRDALEETAERCEPFQVRAEA